MMRMTSQIAVAPLLAAVLLVSAPLCGQIPEPTPAATADDEATPAAAVETGAETEAVPAWIAKREELAAQAREEVMAAVTPAAVAADMGIEGLPAPPQRTVAEVEAAVQREVDRQVNEKYPEAAMAGFTDEAAVKYPFWNVGDEVAFETRNPRLPRVEGTLHAVGRNALRVGLHTVNSADLDEATLAHFYPDKCEELRQEYVRQRMLEYKADRVRYADETAAKLAAQAFTAAGYVNIDDRWLPADEVVRRATARRRREAYIARLKTLLADHDFVYYQQEWMPRERAYFLAAIRQAEGELDPAKQKAILAAALTAAEESPYANLVREYLAQLEQESGAGQGGAMPGENAAAAPPDAVPPNAEEMLAQIELGRTLGTDLDIMLGAALHTEATVWEELPAEVRVYKGPDGALLEVTLQANVVVEMRVAPPPPIPPGPGFAPPIPPL